MTGRRNLQRISLSLRMCLPSLCGGTNLLGPVVVLNACCIAHLLGPVSSAPRAVGKLLVASLTLADMRIRPSDAAAGRGSFALLAESPSADEMRCGVIKINRNMAVHRGQNAVRLRIHRIWLLLLVAGPKLRVHCTSLVSVSSLSLTFLFIIINCFAVTMLSPALF